MRTLNFINRNHSGGETKTPLLLRSQVTPKGFAEQLSYAICMLLWYRYLYGHVPGTDLRRKFLQASPTGHGRRPAVQPLPILATV